MWEVTAAEVRVPLVTGVRDRTIATALALVAAVVLPEVFHALGAATGVGPSVAQALLPMHLPVLLVGLLAGPVAGGVTGVMAPLIAFALSGMPPAEILPFMAVELAAYGIVAGLLDSHPMGTLRKVLIAQVAGRVVRLVAVVVAASTMGNVTTQLAAGWDATLAAWPGIVLQWCLIPPVMYWAGRNRSDHEH